MVQAVSYGAPNRTCVRNIFFQSRVDKWNIFLNFDEWILQISSGRYNIFLTDEIFCIDSKSKKNSLVKTRNKKYFTRQNENFNFFDSSKRKRKYSSKQDKKIVHLSKREKIILQQFTSWCLIIGAEIIRQNENK